MRKKYKRLLIVIIIFIVIIVGLIVIKKVTTKSVKNDVKVVDSIDSFSYTLDERDTILMKNTYNELKKVLKEKTIDKEKYASLLAELFVIDLFTIDNKINKYDVACLEYVYPSSIDNFKMNVEDTLYKRMEDNTFGKRKQKLPVVKSVNVSDVENNTFKINDKEMESFVVKLTWDYEENLGYDTSASITLVEDSNKLYVVEYETGVNNE